MKKHLLTLILFGAIILQGFGQSSKLPAVDSKEYEQLKMQGKLPGGLPVISNPKSFTPSLEDLQRLGAVHKMPASGGCGCYKAPDSSYTLAMPPVDDGSSSLISIPFNFCLYGTNYTSLYINNNGNISFDMPYGTYSSDSFPTTSFVMVAPFWADVDTRPAGGGTVKYKITPTAMYVNWTAVGYYSMMTDKVNTFQLIITDGTDPVLPSGNNIAFCYGDMQWTTGAASGGVGGFGGTATGAYPATVGVNKGDGISYLQMGRFSRPGAAYDGGYGTDDGVDWLDNKSLYFNVCSGNNIPPIASITPPLLSGGGGCDTLKLCGTNDTLLINALFLSPEIGQITNIAVNLYGTPGFSVLSNTPGNSASAQVQIVASPANAGMNLITFTATDDGTPAGITTINLNIFVDTTGLAAFNPSIIGNLEFCVGDSTTLSVTPTTFDSYVWNTGSTSTSIVASTPGDYWVTSRKNGCFKTNLVHVATDPPPTPQIVGPLFTCGSTPTILYVDSVYTNYLWSNASTNDSINVLSGTYIVTVTDSHGCKGKDTVTVVNANPTVAITGVADFCPGTSISLVANPSFPSGANYLWSNSDTTQSAVVSAGGTYSVHVSYSNGCSTSDTVSVTQYSAPHANFSTSPSGTSAPLTTVSFTDLSTVTPGTIVAWYWNFGDSLGSVSSLQNPTHSYAVDGTYHVTLAVQSNNGCWDTIRIDYIVVSDIEVPNVFTPNNDGKNDKLAFKNLEFFPGTSLTVYNRWGNKIYSSPNYQNDWDGAGHSDGVYYYVLSGPLLKETRYGFVQLLR